MTYFTGDDLVNRTSGTRVKIIRVTGSEFDRQYLLEVAHSMDAREVGTRSFATEHTLDTRYQKVIMPS